MIESCLYFDGKSERDRDRFLFSKSFTFSFFFSLIECYQYRVGNPLCLIHSLKRFSTEPANVSVTLFPIWSHCSINISLNSYSFVSGVRFRICRLSSFHKCSIGFKSGLCGGQLRRLTRFPSNCFVKACV